MCWYTFNVVALSRWPRCGNRGDRCPGRPEIGRNVMTQIVEAHSRQAHRLGEPPKSVGCDIWAPRLASSGI